jgi:hypothetical protein
MGTPVDDRRSTTVLPPRYWEAIMVNPREFLENWVRESVQATPYRNKAEARRLAYECRKAAERADVAWFAVVNAAGGDVQDYILTELNRAAASAS